MKRRDLCVAVLGLALVAPAFAQGQGGGPGGPGGPGGGGRRGFGGPGFGFGGGLMGLVRMPEVQKELKVDDAQKTLLEGLQPQGFGGRPGGPGGPGGAGGGGGARPGGPGGPGGGQFDPAEFQKRMEAMRLDQEKKIGEILDKNQMARLKQLDLQQQGIRSIGRPDVQTSLKISADQKSKIDAATTGERETMMQMFRPQDGSQPDFQAMRTKMTELRAGTDAKLNAILTPAQKTQFTSMQGAPFKFPERPAFGGFGGRGGRPGGGGNN